MLILKASPDLEESFSQMLRQYKRDIGWRGIFIVNNDNIILYGKSYSLCCSFDNRKIFMDMMSNPISESLAIECRGNHHLINAINIIMYVFGKWGMLKGLNVKQKYPQLNKLFAGIFSQFGAEVSLDSKGVYFKIDGAGSTYEDVLNKIIDATMPEEGIFERPLKDTKEEKAKPSRPAPKEEKDDELPDYPEEEKEEKKVVSDEHAEAEERLSKAIEKEEEALGLWYDMVWKHQKLDFEFKPLKNGEDKKGKDKIAKNFAKTGYMCPNCNENLHMVVFPPEDEMLVKIDGDRLYMARAFSCKNCKQFYTPFPDRLITEKDVFSLSFSNDEPAYNDYLELLSEKGHMGGNSNFNEYESVKLGLAPKEEIPQKTDDFNINDLEDAIEHVDELSREEMSQIVDKMESGFFPRQDLEKFREFAENALTDKYDNALKDADIMDIDELEAFKDEALHNMLLPKKYKKVFVDRLDEEISARKAKSATDDKEDANNSFDPLDEIDKQAAPKKAKKKKEKDYDDSDFVLDDTDISPKESMSEPVKNEEEITDFEEKPVKEKKEKKAKKPKKLKLKLSGSADEEDDFSYVAAPKLKKAKKEKIKKDEPTLQKLPKENKIHSTKDDDSDFVLKGEPKNKEKIIIEDEAPALSTRELLDMASSCNGKDYKHIKETIKNIKDAKVKDEGSKEKILSRLGQYKANRGKKEAFHLLSKLPNIFSKDDYFKLKDRLKNYDDEDAKEALEELEHKLDKKEQAEIKDILSSEKADSRLSLHKLFSKLLSKGFEGRNVGPFLERIKSKLMPADKAYLNKLCGNLDDLSIKDLINLKKKVVESMVLPELKIEQIAEIEDHLSKLKSQETALLVEKVKKDMADAGFDLTPLSFNNIGTDLEGDSQNPDNIILENAVNSYGDPESKYELPIFCHDASKRPSGKRGFMITPEHLYTGARTSTASYKIGNLGNFSVKKKRIKQSLVLDTASDGEITLPCSYKNEELEKFASSLNSFVGYLKERPESRSIDYMLQSEHESIICMRCGAKFNDENICPECGMLGGKVD